MKAIDCCCCWTEGTAETLTPLRRPGTLPVRCVLICIRFASSVEVIIGIILRTLSFQSVLAHRLANWWSTEYFSLFPGGDSSHAPGRAGQAKPSAPEGMLRVGETGSGVSPCATTGSEEPVEQGLRRPVPSRHQNFFRFLFSFLRNGGAKVRRSSRQNECRGPTKPAATARPRGQTARTEAYRLPLTGALDQAFENRRGSLQLLQVQRVVQRGASSSTWSSPRRASSPASADFPAEANRR